MACDVDVVFDADPGSVERTGLGWLVIAARWHDDPSTDTSSRSVEGKERIKWLVV